MYDLMFKYIKDKHLDKSYVTAVNNRICLGILGQGLNLMECDKSIRIEKSRKYYQQKDIEKHISSLN